MSTVKNVVIVDAVRTPVGRHKGVLKDIRPDDLAAEVIKAIINRNERIDPEEIEEVLLGCANQAGEDNRNVARMAGLLAGLPETVGGSTVNRLCGSGLDSINQAYRSLALGEGDVYIAGGTESMTRAPWVMGKPEMSFPKKAPEVYDTTIGWRFINNELQKEYGTLSMPETAQEVANRFSISRKEQDEFAFKSQQKTAFAMEKGKFDNELIPIEVPINKKERGLISTDEHPRPNTTLEKLASLPSIFENGSITAGNASGINDGASVVLMMTEEKAKSLGIKRYARIVSTGVQGVDPNVMGLGPISATRKALQRAGLRIEDMSLVELNEAFAAQSIACIRELGIDTEKLNVNGGAIALGHPLGASGARITTTLFHELRKRDGKYGLATMCIGVGQGIATIIENVF